MVRLAALMLLALAAGAMTAPAFAAEGAVCIENATIDDLQAALRTGRTTAADLVRWCAGRLARRKVPRRIEFCETLP